MLIDSSIKRNIYAQTGNFSFQADFIFDNHSGDCLFGFFGNNFVEFKANSGRLIDHQNNYFGSYKKNRLVSLSGNISADSIDYYLNREPIAFGIPRETGDLNYFYINVENCSPQLNLYINGEKPNYSFSDLITYNTGTTLLPITITNNSNLPFKIFSGQFDGDLNKFSLSGLNDIEVDDNYQFYFLQSGANTAGLNNLGLNLYTNFGIERVVVNASGVQNKLPFYYIELNGPNTVNNNSSSIYYCYFSNPSGQMEILPSLNYVSGSGEFSSNIIVTGNYSGIISGDITNSGNLILSQTSNASGFGLTGKYVTGIITENIEFLQFATGAQPLYVSTNISGMGHTNGYTGIGVVLYNGYVTGTILDGSGILQDSLFVESSQNGICFSPIPTGYINATGKIDFGIPQNGDVLFIGTQGIVNGFNYTDIGGLNNYINAQGKVSSYISGSSLYLTAKISGASGNSIPFSLGLANQGTMSTSSTNGHLNGGNDLGIGAFLTASGTFSGYTTQPLTGSGYYEKIVTGTFTGSINQVDYEKTFFEVWDLKTGLTLDSLVSYTQNNYISGNSSYINNSYKSDNSSFFIQIDYNNNYPTGDIAELSLTGLNLPTGIFLQIGGII